MGSWVGARAGKVGRVEKVRLYVSLQRRLGWAIYEVRLQWGSG